MYIGDLHIHSRYSRLQAGIVRRNTWIYGPGKRESILWGPAISPIRHGREELKEKLEPAEDGLYTLKDEYRIHGRGGSG